MEGLLDLWSSNCEPHCFSAVQFFRQPPLTRTRCLEEAGRTHHRGDGNDGRRRKRTRRNRRRSTKAQNNESPGEKQCSGRSLAVISVLITAREGDYARHYALSREKRKGKKGKW